MNDEHKEQSSAPNAQEPHNAPASGDTLDRWLEENLHAEVPTKPVSQPQPQKEVAQAQKMASKYEEKPVFGTSPKPTTPHSSSQNRFARGQHHRKNNRPYAKNHSSSLNRFSAQKNTAPSPKNFSGQTNAGNSSQHNHPQVQEKRGFFGMLRKKNSHDSGTVNASTSHHSTTAAEPPRGIMRHFANHRPGTHGAPHYRGKMRIIPLGGLDEVGKNCMLLEYGNDIIIIDMGFQFPEEDMLGIDYVIPDVTYLEDKVDRIRGVLITHGHLDHIGAIPYLMPKLKFPTIYGTKLTMGLVQKRLEEFGQERQAKCKTVTTDDVLQLGQFQISFFPVNHSIPDAMGIVVKSPAGNIVHTGDFKFDFTPSGDQKPADFAKIAALSTQDIAALFIDSTNALKPGYTISEKKIGDSLESIIKNIEGRIIIASFASQIGRMQQIIDYAKKYHRTIFLSGRSLIDNIHMAGKLGYLRIPQGLIHDIRRVHKIPEQHALILTTGSQGESVSALTRMALEDHPNVKIKKGDTVVLSSSPIPGNERAIFTVVNNLSRLGAKIINNQIMDVHTSGHAQQEDLKLMMSLVKAKSVAPVHGEYFMRMGNKDIAMSIGYEEKDTILVENGGVIEVENGRAKATGESVQTNYILVDGLGVGDVGTQVMMDRQTLAENGVLIVLIPVNKENGKLHGEVDVISRGFIYMKESEELVNSIKEIARDAYQNIMNKRSDAKRADVKKYIKETVDKFVHQKIERHPLVLPIVIEQ